MARCESCGNSGYEQKEMKVDFEKKIFVGPCCVRADTQTLFEDTELKTGVEFSSRVGIKAYASYGGLSVEFKKSKEEIDKWMDQTKKATPQEEEQTSSLN